jgi:sirohydrochlorin ferrochelatase
MTQAALIVAHGQPSDPDPAEAELARLAASVAVLLPDWRIGFATLAAPGALARAVAKLGPEGRAYPLFMAGGWFTRVQLPARLAAAGAPLWQVLEPLGCDPDLHALAVQIVKAEAPETVLLAAHGSFKSAVPADIAAHVVAAIAKATGCRTEAAFIDQAPQLSHATGHGPRAICLPFFATEGGHVRDDIPAALQAAGFQGRILPPLGLHPDVPALIAKAISRGVAVCADRCRWQRGQGADA